jgi:hypothetical protein
MSDKIGELIARSRYWSERAAHHTDRGAALRCAARADLLKQAIKDELGHALGRMSASPRELEVLDTMHRVTPFRDEAGGDGFMRSEVQLELPLLVCAWSARLTSPPYRNGCKS